MATTVQRETYEFLTLNITDGSGAAYTGDWSYQIVARGARPDEDDWLPSVTHNSQQGVDIQGLEPGAYDIFYRPDDDPPYLPVPEPISLIVR